MLQQLREQATATPRRRRLLKVAAVLLALWVLLSLFAWLAGPRLITSLAVDFVDRELGHRLQVGELAVNPLKLAVTVRDLALSEPGGAGILSFRELVVDVDVTTLVRGMVVLDEFRLADLLLNIERLEADRFNFSLLAQRLAERATPEDDSGPTVHFLVRHTAVSNAAFRFADHTKQPLFESWMRPINLSMEDLTSRPEREAPYDIVATIGSGGTLGWQGDLSLEPLRSKGRVELKGFGLQAAYEYVKSQFAFALPAGELNVRLDYLADFSGEQSELKIVDGAASVDNLAITDDAGNPLFAFRQTAATGITADLLRSTATVALLETQGGRVDLVLEADGNTNIQRALLPAQPAPAPAAPAAPAAELQAVVDDAAAPAEVPWQVSVQRAAIRDYALHVTDRGTVPAVDFVLSDVDFAVEGLRLPDAQAMPFTLSAVPGEGSTLTARGEYHLATGAVAVELALVDAPLEPFSPYLARAGRLSLVDGSLSWEGRVTAADNGSRDLVATGSGRLRNLVLRDDIHRARLASLAELAVEGLDYHDALARLSLRRLVIAGLNVDVAMDRDGQLNLQQVFAAAAPATGATPPPAEAARPLALRLDSLVLRDNTFNFRDDSPDLRFSAQLSRFGGRIDGLSSDPARRAKVQLDGVVNRYAPLAISGEVNPLAAQTWSDLRVRLRDLDLTALTPYTVTYIAYPLERGKLALELDWKVADRRFDSQNRVLLDGIALGEKREAPRATKLPVRLGLALLTDSQGDADLRVPAYGELDDPKFRVGQVVLQALGNLLVKAATSPFALLGGSGGGQADSVPFAAGDDTLPPSEQTRLAELARALAEKPQLLLVITGAAAASDRAALQRDALELQLRREYLASPFRRGTVDTVTLTDAQRLELLATLYRRATGNALASLRDDAGRPLDDAARRLAAETALLPGFAIDDGALRELARARAVQVKDVLLAAGLAEARLVMADGALLADAVDPVPTKLAVDAR